jgi:hypothetical protein
MVGFLSHGRVDENGRHYVEACPLFQAAREDYPQITLITLKPIKFSLIWEIGEICG